MAILKNLLTLIKRFLGWPPEPTEEQKNEKLITMREDRDCAVVAVATACGVTYEAASKALWHWNLPSFLESPLLSNPLNVKRAIEKLKFTVNNAKISSLLKGELKAGKTICLMHNPDNAIAGILQQHWVVFMGKRDNIYIFHWAESQQLVEYTESSVVDMLTSGWPNCIYEVVDREKS